MPSTGSVSWDNWVAQLAGTPSGDTLEYPFFSDAHLVGEAFGLGPYDLINAISDHRRPIQGPGAVLRVAFHAGQTFGPMERTDFSRHHGGYLQDEIAALLALEIGARVKGASATRWFKQGEDAKGRPWSFQQLGQWQPTLFQSLYGPLLPHLTGQRNLHQLELLPRYPSLLAEKSIVLVRAARLYQDAIWVADLEPALTWLLLASSLEVAANDWRNESTNPVENLRSFKPEIEQILIETGGTAALEPLARLLAPTMGSTRKFVDFCVAHLPAPPPIRPQQPFEQIAWDAATLRRGLIKIYDYRSRALHDGTPFPLPMCMPPRGDRGAYEEKPAGLAAGTGSAVWMAVDLPMMLHVFHYITRSVLLSWWRSLLPGA